MRQQTIKSSISCSGIGIHSGELVNIRLNPAPANHGIVLIRTDKFPRVRIPAICEYIKSALNASTLGVNGTRVGTVEHLMAALAGLGIDNAEVEVDGPEIPILDGSAAPFVQLIKAAGIIELSTPRSYLVVRKPIEVRVNGSYAAIKPSLETKVNCTISYNHPLLHHQELELRFSPEEFETEIAHARTFGFLEDVDRLRSLGLAKGGSLHNAVILDRHGVINREGFRCEDECVRHKLLDLIGDLALCGLPVLGEITVHKAGHALHHLLVHRLLSNPECFDVVEDTDHTGRHDHRHSTTFARA
jgi:UDP-3-O-[3-hydroxymyristoyl] N-acetylglucosamine deacetylase